MSSITIKLDEALKEELEKVRREFPKGLPEGTNAVWRVIMQEFPYHRKAETFVSLAIDFSFVTFTRD